MPRPSDSTLEVIYSASPPKAWHHDHWFDAFVWVGAVLIPLAGMAVLPAGVEPIGILVAVVWMLGWHSASRIVQSGRVHDFHAELRCRWDSEHNPGDDLCETEPVPQ
jgi:hypothetical protein